MALREICAAVLSPKNPPFRRANPGWRSGPVPPILRRFPEGIPPARPDLRRFPAAAASRCGPPPLSWQISVFACSSPALRSAVRRYPARAPPLSGRQRQTSKRPQNPGQVLRSSALPYAGQCRGQGDRIAHIFPPGSYLVPNPPLSAASRLFQARCGEQRSAHTAGPSSPAPPGSAGRRPAAPLPGGRPAGRGSGEPGCSPGTGGPPAG